MAWLIMNDLVNYESTFYPTHILGYNNEIMPVYIGNSSDSIIEEKAIGIYVTDEDYNKIDHSKEYVLIHDPDSQSKVSFNHIVEGSELYKVIEDIPIGNVKDKETMNRVHYHIL